VTALLVVLALVAGYAAGRRHERARHLRQLDLDLAFTRATQKGA
jgi:hypothetical protein